MIGLFRKLQKNSKSLARERLHAVLERDRLILKQTDDSEKLRKEITEVILKYTGGNSSSFDVSVTLTGDFRYLVKAIVPMNVKESGMG